jgi:molybdate-binding protein/DNA-binding XRE family transcriptional regulator
MASGESPLRARRERLGMSQLELAAAADLSRQSLSAIEAGRSQPGVDVALRLAAVLECRVEDLFVASTRPRVRAELAGAVDEGRVALAEVGGRWVAHPLVGLALRTSADGLAARGARGKLEVEPVRPLEEARDNVVVMGCAPALALLCDRLSSRASHGRYLWMTRSSTAALEALGARHTHVAGVHLVDARTGEPNLAEIRRIAGPAALTLVALARWEAGLVLAAGNPLGVRKAEDLGRRGLRLVTRERGSGARRLLDRLVASAGERAGAAARSAIQVGGQLEVAHAVSIGAADAGVATRDAALAFGLAFVPLAEERYDLAIPRDGLEDPRILRLLDALTSAPLRRELAALGYDVRCSGDRIADVSAA